MTKSRDFGPIAGQIRGALDAYSKEELADLLTHLVRTYVVEADAPIQMETPQSTLPSNLESLAFAQLILHMQMNLPQSELKQFRVSGNRVWVEKNGREIVLSGGDEPAAMEEPPDADIIAPAPRIEMDSAPAVRVSQPSPGTRTEESAPMIAQRDANAPVGTPRARTQPAQSTPAANSNVQRPSVRLRDEFGAAAPPVGRQSSGPKPRVPPPEQPKKEKVTDTSDRFSMLELD